MALTAWTAALGTASAARPSDALLVPASVSSIGATVETAGPVASVDKRHHHPMGDVGFRQCPDRKGWAPRASDQPECNHRSTNLEEARDVRARHVVARRRVLLGGCRALLVNGPHDLGQSRLG